MPLCRNLSLAAEPPAKRLREGRAICPSKPEAPRDRRQANWHVYRKPRLERVLPRLGAY